MIARVWSYLTSLNLARRPAPPVRGGEPPTYAMWLERDVDAAVARHPAGRHRA